MPQYGRQRAETSNPALSIHTDGCARSSRGAMRDGSPPRTPGIGPSRAQKGKASMRTLDTQRAPAAQETFLDDSTPVDGPRWEGQGAYRTRDSHDLSFSNNTRHSIVDNMLMSLGSLPNGGASYSDHFAHYKKFEDYDFSSSSPTFAPKHADRFPGDTSSPLYSEFDQSMGNTSSRYSRQRSPRGCRSNSSSEFRAGRSRLDSGSSNGYNTANVGMENPRRGTTADHSASGHARGGAKKGSKSSGSSSVDFAYSQVIGPGRLGNRSASFDQSYVERAPRSPPPRMLSHSVLDRGRPKVDAYRELDDFYTAAPQPTVPTGARRHQEPPISPPAFLPQPVYGPPEAPVHLPRTSSKPVTSNGSHSSPSNAPEPPNTQTANTVDTIISRTLPIPAFTDPPAPSPTVATRKPSAPNPPSTSAPKERPGFFKRMFGSSKSQTSGHHESTPQPSHVRSLDVSLSDNTTASQSHANQNQIPQQRALSKAPSKEATSISQEQPQAQPVRLKKKQSFFRRRKLSVASQIPQPVLPLPLQLAKHAETMPVQPSPSRSSLFKVMNPYLSESKSPVSPAEAYFDSREHQPNTEDEEIEQQPHGFSPGYAPHKNAAVRAVKPGSRDTDRSVPSIRDDAVKTSQSPVSDSPKLKLKMKSSRTSRLQPQDQTFLADSSGNEDKSGEPESQAVRSPSSGYPDEASKSQFSPASPTSLQQQPPQLPDSTPHRKANFGEKRTGVRSPEPLDLNRFPLPAGLEEDEWVITTPTKKEPSTTATSGRSTRVWLAPTSSEEKLRESSYLSIPSEGAASSDRPSPASENPSPSTTNDVFQSVTSLPAVYIHSDGNDAGEDEVTMDAATTDEPTDEDRAAALKIYHGEEEFISKARAAAWLGETTARSARTRKAYMELYDWAGLNILYSMRDLCGKLVLKAETQQVDRVLDAFSSRWCECNPNHGFKATDVVHTICYSILLLNTDLHLADIEQKMTRSQFVKNTLPTIRRIAIDAAPEAMDETVRAQGTNSRGAIPGPNPHHPVWNPLRSKSGLRWRSRDSCNVLIKAPFEGSMRSWEFQIEVVLKEFYNSIRQQRLPLHGARPELLPEPSSSNLSVLAGSMLRRTPSVLSKAPSENPSYRGRAGDFRSATSRFNSKGRSKTKAYPASTIGSSRTSLEEASVWSPAGSSTWSKFSLGKTQTSMSMESLGSFSTKGDYQPSIGFANALSQAIIREEGTTGTTGTGSLSEEPLRAAPLLEDETLELAGSPWVKEAILKHKLHGDKKLKDRGWHDCFAVIEKGHMRLFTFSTSTKSARLKAKARNAPGAFAEELAAFCLRQTLASTLPPPGYSKARPHVWALSLPTGAVHLFEVGTEDIVREFVDTANYWAARLSKEPLVGGVSNIEYGWSDAVVGPVVQRRQDSAPEGGRAPRSSGAMSVRSAESLEQATGLGSTRSILPGDRATLSDWKQPANSMMPSNLMEVDQLKALNAYVKNVEEELERHNELRGPMMVAFSPRHPNAAKAMANWEEKSAYLLREIVRFSTYVEALKGAQALKEKIYAERGLLRWRRRRKRRRSRTCRARTRKRWGT
ncbi:hypothetical protein H2199_002231 [Coniosporium tulheliwenetii]|uniref:Uncharacterized protein n=1 Tax=Coniosporium tulheliwenetii TaxID=3383036 RepID=A0ACC2ZI69_9PEZI|nr:hypothetical protein H2199_002231 [Cladosporium sp. JES 115]